MKKFTFNKDAKSLLKTLFTCISTVSKKDEEVINYFHFYNVGKKLFVATQDTFNVFELFLNSSKVTGDFDIRINDREKFISVIDSLSDEFVIEVKDDHIICKGNGVNFVVPINTGEDCYKPEKLKGETEFTLTALQSEKLYKMVYATGDEKEQEDISGIYAGEIGDKETGFIATDGRVTAILKSELPKGFPNLMVNKHTAKVISNIADKKDLKFKTSKNAIMLYNSNFTVIGRLIDFKKGLSKITSKFPQSFETSFTIDRDSLKQISKVLSVASEKETDKKRFEFSLMPNAETPHAQIITTNSDGYTGQSFLKIYNAQKCENIRFALNSVYLYNTLSTLEDKNVIVEFIATDKALRFNRGLMTQYIMPLRIEDVTNDEQTTKQKEEKLKTEKTEKTVEVLENANFLNANIEQVEEIKIEQSLSELVAQD